MIPERSAKALIPEAQKGFRDRQSEEEQMREGTIVMTEHGGDDARTQGPSISRPVDTDVSLSASQLAKMAKVHPHDVQYWARSGYLARRQGEEEMEYDPHGERKAFNLSQLPKAQLMALFSKRLQMKPSRAAELADQFLEVYKTDSDAFSVTIGTIELLDRKITALVELLLELDVLPRLRDILKEEP